MTNVKRLPNRLLANDIELKKISPKNDKECLEELLTVYSKNRKHLIFWHHGRKELVFKNIEDIKKHLRGNRLACYLLYSSGEIVGCIEIGRLSTDEENMKFRTLAYWTDKKHIRKGIMYNTLSMIEKTLLGQGLDFIKTEVDIGNEPSIKLMKKLNYKTVSIAIQISESAETIGHFITFIKQGPKNIKN
jgi:RimJ/RimL family protein N-acetyltransferase